MRALIPSLFLLAAALPVLGQAANAGAGLPKEPREVFAAAAPFYDFTSANLKPRHLKATYQLYDEKGKPAEQGTYEYWWASPKVYRSTWTRPSAARTDWHTADGKHATTATGGALSYFEDRLESVLLWPLPTAIQLDPTKFRLEDQSITANRVITPCYMVVPVAEKIDPLHPVRRGQFSTYCFNAQLPVVAGIYSFGTLLTTFRDFVQMQGRVLPREVDFRDGKRNVLTAQVNSVNGLNPSDAALTPSEDSILVKSEEVTNTEGVTFGKLLKQTDVEYHDGSGTVWLQTTIGTDGHVHQIRVITSTSPALSAVALRAASQWVYAPSTLRGEPVEVQIEIEINIQQN